MLSSSFPTITPYSWVLQHYPVFYLFNLLLSHHFHIRVAFTSTCRVDYQITLYSQWAFVQHCLSTPHQDTLWVISATLLKAGIRDRSFMGMTWSEKEWPGHVNYLFWIDRLQNFRDPNDRVLKHPVICPSLGKHMTSSKFIIMIINKWTHTAVICIITSGFDDPFTGHWQNYNCTFCVERVTG